MAYFASHITMNTEDAPCKTQKDGKNDYYAAQQRGKFTVILVHLSFQARCPGAEVDPVLKYE
jgi:hypothetical protein